MRHFAVPGFTLGLAAWSARRRPDGRGWQRSKQLRQQSLAPPGACMAAGGAAGSAQQAAPGQWAARAAWAGSQSGSGLSAGQRRAQGQQRRPGCGFRRSCCCAEASPGLWACISCRFAIALMQLSACLLWQQEGRAFAASSCHLLHALQVVGMFRGLSWRR